MQRIHSKTRLTMKQTVLAEGEGHCKDNPNIILLQKYNQTENI